MRVVICGGGVIGACTAYFLSLRQVEVIVVERTGVACAASGKSGGFLALDWCDGSPLGRLARRSFNLHAELAAQLDGSRWGYRRLDTWSVLAGARRSFSGGSAVSGPVWLGERALVQGKLGTQATTAQVHPARFTEAMLQAAIGMGAQLRLGCVTDVVLDAGRTTALGVKVDGVVLEADAIVIAMGPWSMTACQWLPLPAVYGLKGNSVVYQSGSRVSADALFVELTTSRRHGAYAGGVSARRRHDLRLRSVQPAGSAGRSRRCRARPRGTGCAASDDPRLRTGSCGHPDRGHPGLLPAGDAGWPAAARPGAGRRQCVRRHRAQRLGHPQCAGQWRGHGGADRRRERPSTSTSAGSIPLAYLLLEHCILGA